MLVASSRLDVAHYYVAEDDVDAEVERLRSARNAVARELNAMKRDLPPDIPELRALGQHRAPDHVVDLASVDAGAFDRRLQRESAERRTERGVEGALVGAADGRSGS